MTVDEGNESFAAVAANHAAEGTVYVVQMLEEHEIETEGDPVVKEYWRDVATVTVPKRAHRRRAVEQALALPECAVLRPATGEQHKFRALDADAAEEIPAGVRVSTELVVG